MANRKRADLIFATEDPYKNIVRLERDTWERHITKKHEEVGGREFDIRKTIETPDRIKRSTRDQDVVAFEKCDLRAFVQYEALDFEQGNTFGKLTSSSDLLNTPRQLQLALKLYF